MPKTEVNLSGEDKNMYTTQISFDIPDTKQYKLIFHSCNCMHSNLTVLVDWKPCTEI